MSRALPAHVVLLVFALAAPVGAQQTDSIVTPIERATSGPAVARDSTTWTAPRKRPLLSITEAMAVNVIVNRVDAWAGNQWWAKVRPNDWSRNLRLGWEWDENTFITNMFAHPYHGGMYLNAGRANGLGFWESAPLSFLGSWVWENLGERHRPSLNDFFMTSFGGIALGEVFHRVGASIRHNGKTGGNRRFREIVSLAFDPVGGLNRLYRGEWSRIQPNPPEHNPSSFVFRMGAGGSWISDTGSVDTVTSSATLLLDLDYGDRYSTPFRAPFDVFSLRAQISPSAGGLANLRASGRLFSHELTRRTARHRQQFEINQRYDYNNNPAFQFGAQSVEGGLVSRWNIRGGFAIRTEAFAALTMLGGLDAPFSGVGERSYDFGPGAGVRFDVALERRGVTFLTLIGRSEYLHSVSGAEADHFVNLGGVELAVPVARGLGIGLHAVYFDRTSRYTDSPDEKRIFPEARLLLIWTTSQRPKPAPVVPPIPVPQP